MNILIALKEKKYVDFFTKCLIILAAFCFIPASFGANVVLLHTEYFIFSLASIYTILLSCLLLIRLLQPPFLNKFYKFFTILVIIYISTIPLLNYDTIESIRIVYFRTIFFIIALIGFYKITEEVDYYYVINIFFVAAICFLIFHSSAFLIKSEGFYDPEINNYHGFFSSKHPAGIILFGFIPFAFLKLKKYDRLSYKFYSTYLVFCLLIFFLFFTYSRTAILSYIIFIIALFMFKRNIKEIILLSVPLIITIILLYFISLEYYYDSWLKPEIVALNSDVGILGKGRFQIFIEGWKYFKEQNLSTQLFGRGIGKSFILHEIVTGIKSNTHVQIVQLFVEYGIIGTLLILSLFSRLIYDKVKLFIVKRSFIGVIGIGVMLSFIATFFYAMPLSWGFIVLPYLFWITQHNYIKDI